MAPGCNYFCIKSVPDFDRVAKQFAASFFQTVRELELRITSKVWKQRVPVLIGRPLTRVSQTHAVKGIYGGGKEGTVEEHDTAGWT